MFSDDFIGFVRCIIYIGVESHKFMTDIFSLLSMTIDRYLLFTAIIRKQVCLGD
jgi:hypothetical protein